MHIQITYIYTYNFHCKINDNISSSQLPWYRMLILQLQIQRFTNEIRIIVHFREIS